MNYPLYQKTLCPDIWDGKNLRPEIRTTLLKIAADFIKELGENHELKIEADDILFIGSLTNYNWTSYSDIDLHISADYSKLVMPPKDAQIMFDAIKAGWNKTHNITIKGHDVEIYVQDMHDHMTSAAEYSIKRGEWIKEPVFNAPQFNKDLIKTKFKEYQGSIQSLSTKHDEDGLRRLLEKIYKFRRAGLNAGGELSEENIVFKILRSSGLLDKLKDTIVRIYDKKMSVDEMLFESSKIGADVPDETHMIDDGISSPDGQTVVWKKDKDEQYCLVPTDNEDQKRMRIMYGMPVFAAYQIMRTAVLQRKGADYNFAVSATNIMTQLRHAIKHPTPNSEKTMEALIDLSVKRMAKQSQINLNDISVIVPLGSKSGLNKQVAKRIHQLIPKAIVLEDFLQKDAWKNVQLSPYYYARRRATMQKYKYRPLDLEQKLAFFEQTKRHIQAKHENFPNDEFAVAREKSTARMYFSLFYKVSDRYKMDAIKLLNGANILFIDDTQESGATLVEAARAIKEFYPKSILTYIFLFSRNVTEE